MNHREFIAARLTLADGTVKNRRVLVDVLDACKDAHPEIAAAHGYCEACRGTGEVPPTADEIRMSQQTGEPPCGTPCGCGA